MRLFFAVELPVFTGPFRLLADLILEQKVDVCDVSVATITDRFLARNTAHMFHSGVSIMDKDRIKGSLKQVVGRVKEAVGHAVGDKKAQQDGKAAQISGKAASMGEGVVVTVLDALIKDFASKLATL